MMLPPKPQGPPPPIPPQSASPKNIKVNTKTANVGLTNNNQSPASPKKKNWQKIIIIAAIVFLSLGAIAGAFFLLQERQDIRKGATSSGKLICMPLDDNGNITNDKYHYDRMLIKNETDQDIQIKIQQNLCPYQEQNLELGPGYHCDDFVSANPYIVRAGTQVIIPSPDTASWLPADWIPCQKVGQLDVQKDKDHYQHIGVDPNTIPDCFNTVDNRVWEGGVAFTIKANKAPCSEPSCPDITMTIGQRALDIIQNNNNAQDNNTNSVTDSVIPIVAGKPVHIAVYSPEPLVCTEISQYSGLKESPKNPQTRGQYTWTWDAVAGDTAGEYSLTFRGNTQDSGQGECPERAIGEWCQISKPFTIITQEPPPTTIITQPEYSCNCHTVKVYDQNKNLLAREQLENLKAGDLIYIGVVANNGYPNYPVSKARIRVNRNYWLEQDETEEKINHDYPDHLTEFIRPYTIPEGVLNFKIEAEIYLNGPSGVGGWF